MFARSSIQSFGWNPRMNKMLSPERKFYLLTALIACLSFRCYASLYYPILNSDHAVSILMLHDLHLPSDFYFWGQDRIGSFIPVLGQLLYKGLHLSALASESITHYLILLMGFLALSTFISSYFYKTVLALVWFFPPMRFIDVIALYSGVEYSLIAMACYLYVRYSKGSFSSVIKTHLCLVSITVLLLCAIWVSDMAIISIGILLGLHLIAKFRDNAYRLNGLLKPELLYLLTGLIGGTLFFHFAKAHSPNRMDYATFSDVTTIKSSFEMLGDSVFKLFAFKGDEVLTSIYCYLLLLFLALFIYGRKKSGSNVFQSIWFRFFLLDALVVFLLIMVSQWTFLNGVPRRYFTCTYISLSVVLLMLLDRSAYRPGFDKIVKGLLVTTVLIGGVGTLYNLKYFWPRTLKPKAEVVKEFRSLGEIGIIAEYWNAYIVGVTDPGRIKTTPHDGEYVRNPALAEAVLHQPRIYIIRDMWMDTFPDTLVQFHHPLVKAGQPFHLGDCEVCLYRKVK